MANILIIEDIKEIGDNLSEFAHLAGHSSRYAQRFADLTVSHLHEATHIILDLNMPEHDGIDILEALSEEHIEAPIILCSGMTEDIISSAIDVVNELGLSFGGALPKPFTYDQFRHIVSSAKKNNSSAAHQRTERDAISLTRGDLRIAIQREWFYPVYQPQYDITNNSIMGIECLARLNHPLFGQCTPDVFINRLIETDLMDEFTVSFIKNTVSQLRKSGFPVDRRISFNIAPQSLHKPLINKLLRYFLDHGIDQHQICFEITEVSEIKLTKELKTLLTKLRLGGIHISMDDFGTGFSTIHELDNLPFDEVKIDREFVFKITERSGSLAIVRNIVALGKDLGMVVIAEGVETLEQAELLASVECRYMQGFYFSKPVDITTLMAQM